MRKITLIMATLAIVALGACKKTGEGEYEVQKPVFGTVTDTVRTPTVDVEKDTVTVEVPKIDVNKRDSTP